VFDAATPGVQANELFVTIPDTTEVILSPAGASSVITGVVPVVVSVRVTTFELIAVLIFSALTASTALLKFVAFVVFVAERLI